MKGVFFWKKKKKKKEIITLSLLYRLHMGLVGLPHCIKAQNFQWCYIMSKTISQIYVKELHLLWTFYEQMNYFTMWKNQPFLICNHYLDVASYNQLIYWKLLHRIIRLYKIFAISSGGNDWYFCILHVKLVHCRMELSTTPPFTRSMNVILFLSPQVYKKVIIAYEAKLAQFLIERFVGSRRIHKWKCQSTTLRKSKE